MLGLAPFRPKASPHRLIPLSEIRVNPAQPRRVFEELSLLELAESIRTYGILNPLSVRQTPDGYELIAGERRLRAARMAGLSRVPCLVFAVDNKDASLLALIENLQRKDLNFFEVAEGYRRIIDTFGLTQEETAARVGKSQSSVANKLRLLRFSGEERIKLLEAGLTERHARALLRLEDRTRRAEALDRVVKYGWNVGRTEEYVEELLQEAPLETNKGSTLRIFRDVRFFLNTVSHAVDVMRQSGVDACFDRQEDDDGMVLTIRIPKSRTG